MSGPVAIHCIEDPFQFARAGKQHSGQLVITAMLRLQDRLAGNDSTVVNYEVRGGEDRRHRSMLDLEVAATLRLPCDRCLAPLDFPLALQSRVLLSHPGEVQQVDDDPEAPDWIEAGHDLDLLELIEDEILLGLPLAVRHDPENCCSGRSGAGKTNVASTVDAPFARLTTLLERKRKNKW